MTLWGGIFSDKAANCLYLQSVFLALTEEKHFSSWMIVPMVIFYYCFIDLPDILFKLHPVVPVEAFYW